MADSKKRSFHFLIIGDSGIGKTNLMLRFSDDNFVESQLTTIGIDYRRKTINIDDKEVSLNIWDTAGQERFKSITRSYYKNADGIILCYDITNSESFDHLYDWIMEIDSKKVGKEFEILIVGTKNDLESKRCVSHEKVRKFTETQRIDFIETSSKNMINVNEAFILLTKKLLKKNINNNLPEKNKLTNINTISKKKDKTCCQ